jgi:hypothetical protein
MFTSVLDRITDSFFILLPTPSESNASKCPELCSLVIGVSSLLCGGYIRTECKYSLMYLIPILNISVSLLSV